MRTAIAFIVTLIAYLALCVGLAQGQTTRPTLESLNQDIAELKHQVQELEQSRGAWRNFIHQAYRHEFPNEWPPPATQPSTQPTTPPPATKPALTFVNVPNPPEWNEGKRMAGVGDVVENKLFLCSAKTTGIVVAGIGNRIQNCEVEGGENAVLVQDAQSARIDGLTTRKAAYGVFLWATKHWNKGVTLEHLDIDATGGQHGLRLYFSEEVTISDSRLVHFGDPAKANLNIRIGRNIRIERVTTRGRNNGFGPDFTNRTEDAYALDGLVISDCDFESDGTTRFYPRCNGFLVKNTRIKVTAPVAVVDVSDGASGEFNNVKFEGGDRLYYSAKAVRFRGCTYNGQVIADTP